jgi:hypothetical protein
VNVFIWVSAIIAILGYIPLCLSIRSGSAKQNLLTWALWCSLDGIVAATLIAQAGNFLLAAAYTIGSGVTTVFIFRAGDHASWTKFHAMVVGLVVASMAVWYFSGSRMATIAGTIAMIIAGVPQFIDAWEKPKESPTLIYSAYVAANCLAIAGGKNWSVEERFYPVSAGIFCLLITLVSLRKFLPQPEPLTIPGEISS